MNDSRPNPDQLLAQVRREERRAARGKLKIFFGYAAGVGKTYAMLLAARAQQAEGRDVVIGYVEPHGRAETESLMSGLEQLPRLDVTYRGVTLHEFNVDAALARRPALIVVDELAHTNAAGMRHVKRWQDVEELLVAGIDVYTTVNVQHIESLNDVVAQISGVVVRETVPDLVFASANDVVLVDLTPEELLERLKQGKVYVPDQAARALQQFFRQENLAALREMALRQTAERVHEDVESARLGVAAKAPWPTNERLLVCVGPSPTSAKVVRAAKRLADRLGAPWTAVHVARAATLISPTEEEQVHRHLMMAEALGAETARLTGDDIAAELLDYSQRHNVTKIVLGKTIGAQKHWLRPKSSFVDRLLEDSGDIDVIVVRGVEEAVAVGPMPGTTAAGWRQWLGSAAALAIASALAFAFFEWGFSEANLIMIYLLAVVFCGIRFGRWPAIAASVGAVLLFDVLFVAPRFRISVSDSQYLVTFAVMLAVGLTASTLAARMRSQAQAARHNERRTDALYRLTRRLAAHNDRKQVIADAERAIAEVFDAYAIIFQPDEQGKIRPVVDDLLQFAASAAEFAAAQWVYDNNQPAGAGTDTLPSAQALYLPLAAPTGVVGVLAVQSASPESLRTLDDRHLLDTFASHIALAIERSALAERAQLAQVEVETEKLRSSLLSAVSHDIRTPLAGIAGASSTLSSSFDSLDEQTRQDLLASISEESERLAQLVDNLLHMTRLSSGKVAIDRQWHPAEELIGSALSRLEQQIGDRVVEIDIEEGLPMLHVDSILLEQLLVNLLDNAAKYSAESSPVEISLRRGGGGVVIEVADRGRGFAPGEEQRVFDLFYRGSSARTDRRGTGIGLAICRAIAEVHGGTIEAHNRSEGGAAVRVTLPCGERPPQIPEQLAESTRP